MTAHSIAEAQVFAASGSNTSLILSAAVLQAINIFCIALLSAILIALVSDIEALCIPENRDTVVVLFSALVLAINVIAAFIIALFCTFCPLIKTNLFSEDGNTGVEFINT